MYVLVGPCSFIDNLSLFCGRSALVPFYVQDNGSVVSGCVEVIRSQQVIVVVRGLLITCPCTFYGKLLNDNSLSSP